MEAFVIMMSCPAEIEIRGRRRQEKKEPSYRTRLADGDFHYRNVAEKRLLESQTQNTRTRMQRRNPSLSPATSGGVRKT